MRTLCSLASIFALISGAAQAADVAALLEANKAAMSGDGFSGKGAMQLTYAFSGQGLTGTIGTTFDVATGAFIDTSDLGPTTGANGFDGREAWMRDGSGAVTPQGGGDTRQLAVSEAYIDANLWWRRDFGGAEIVDLGARTEGGRSFGVLSVTPQGGKRFEAWFDTQTHRLDRTIEVQGFQPTKILYSDYRLEHGVMVAGKQVIDTFVGPQYVQTQTLTDASFSPPRPLSAYAAPAHVFTDAVIHNRTGRTTTPFKLLNNHIYASVMVNGKGPFTFIFDTGGHDLLTPDTAKALAVKAQGAAAGSGAGEGVVDVGFAKGVDFRIGDLELMNQSIVTLPFEAPQVEGFDEQGMIGFEVFRRFVTVIDYADQTLTFIDPAKFVPSGAGTPIPFVFYNHLPQVEGTFEGRPARFDIDTGSRVALTLTKPYVDKAGLRISHPKGVVAVDGWGVGGRSQSYVTRARGITLGTVSASDVVVGMSLQSKGAFSDPNFEGNVGSGLLKRFTVTLDYARQIMYLKPRPSPAPDSLVFDRSGMWINTAKNGFVIADVTPGGPAATAGLKVGDEITAVNGQAAIDVSISELRQRLRDEPPGTALQLLVSSSGKTRQTTVTLRDQI